MPGETLSVIKPNKLLRYEIWSGYNYRCQFCCWENNDAGGFGQKRPAPLSRSALSKLCQALAATGCHGINLTGGEPLLLPVEELCGAISAIKAEGGINQLWATTNGYALCDAAFCRLIADAGLKELAVSIAAETDEKYSRYTGTKVTLSDILEGIQNAAACGIEVRAHIPLNPAGVSNFNELEVLLHKLEEAGVRTSFFFRLHNSDKINGAYEKLYIDPAEVIREMGASPEWQYGESETGRPYYTNGVMRVNIPRERISIVTENCRSQNCGSYCQGIYSAYLTPDCGGWHIRACHRVFADKRNE